MNIDRLIDFNLFQNVVFYGIHQTMLRKSVCLKFTFLNYAEVWSELDESAVKHLLLFICLTHYLC